jgi:ABC-2 type transport system ATP-binding protein
VVFDEPMSGLDPIGRREVRDLMSELQTAGKTVFFSTHILPDVEAICDRVAIIAKGAVHDVGPVGQLLKTTILGTDVVLEVDADRDHADLVPSGARARRHGHEVLISLGPEVDVDAYLKSLKDAKIRSVAPRKESLEDLYLRVTNRESSDTARGKAS